MRASRGRALAVAIAVLPATAQGQEAPTRARSTPPVRLAVLVAVDQLGQDLLQHYGDVFTGGLRRLLDQGRWYTNAWVDHGITVSHPGHVTLSTGVDPARHGIVDAAFYQTTTEGTRRFLDAVRDSTEGILGEPSSPGVSPYDRHVPILLLGPGTRAGRSAMHATTNNVAPALATLAGLAPPADVDGRVLDGVNVPEARAHHELVYHSGERRAYLVGGSTRRGAGSLFFDDQWAWLDTGWALTHTLPFPRSSHRIVHHRVRNSLVLFGGGSGRTFGADSALWEWRGGEWHRAGVSALGGAAEPGLCYDAKRQRVVAFGGWDRANQYSSALWEWTGDEFLTPPASGPSPRAGHAFLYDPTRERCLLFGGRGAEGFLADTWEWDGHTWRRLDVPGPSRRWFFGATTDFNRSRIVVFGGSNDEGDVGDTWSWNGSRWVLLASDGPMPRGMAKLASDGNAVLLFGGRSQRPTGFVDLNDTWLLHGSAWRRVR